MHVTGEVPHRLPVIAEFCPPSIIFASLAHVPAQDIATIDEGRVSTASSVVHLFSLVGGGQRAIRPDPRITDRCSR